MYLIVGMSKVEMDRSRASDDGRQEYAAGLVVLLSDDFVSQTLESIFFPFCLCFWDNTTH